MSPFTFHFCPPACNLIAEIHPLRPLDLTEATEQKQSLYWSDRQKSNGLVSMESSCRRQAMQRLVRAKENGSLTTAVQVLALPILPGRHQPSIVGRDELNYRVRNGNGWTLILISTNSMSSSTARKQTILYCFASYLSSTKLNFKYRIWNSMVTRTGFEPMLTAWEAAVLTTWPTGHGAPSRTRTGDPLIKSQLLYQLS